MEGDLRFDHIGIVIVELSLGRQVLSRHFGITHWTEVFSDPVNDVDVQFGRDAAGICFELIVPLSAASPVRRWLRTGDNLTNHVAYLVADLAASREALIADDFSPVAEARSAIAYGGRQIQFFMSPLHTLIELIEAPGHQHCYFAGDSGHDRRSARRGS